MSIEGSHEGQPTPKPTPESEPIPTDLWRVAFDALSGKVAALGDSHELPAIAGIDHAPREFYLPLDHDTVADIFKDDLARGQVKSADISFAEAHSDPELTVADDGAIPPELRVNIHSHSWLPNVGDGRGMELNRNAHYLLTPLTESFTAGSVYIEHTITTSEGEIPLPADLLEQVLLEVLRHSADEWEAMAHHSPDETAHKIAEWYKQDYHDLTPDEARHLIALAETLED